MIFDSIVLVSPGEIACHLGNWSIRWYGILIAISFLLGYSVAESLVHKNRLNINHFSNLIFLILIFSVVFARLWFVVLSWDYFKYHLDEIPKIWLGGQSIHGGILGAIIATVIYTKTSTISFYKYIDVIAVVAPLGQAIGRWGNFFNNEAFGLPTENRFLKLYIPQGSRPNEYLNQSYFHPTFLYESIFDLLLFIFLFKKYNVWKNSPGKIFWTYLLLYSLVRFFIEFLRVDSLFLYKNIPCAQFISIIIILISSFSIYSKKKYS